MIDSHPNLIVVDVRGLSEYCSETATPPGHIPGALLHPWSSGVVQGYEELPPDGDILVYCGMSIRSPQAAQFLCNNLPHATVYNMNPGLTAWPYETIVCVDTDGDEINDDLDTCTDTDNDGYGDPGFEVNTCPLDNCPDLANINQADGDGDCIGDACDPEPEVFDPGTPDSYPPGGNECGDVCDCEGDFAGDADVDGTDAATFKADFGRKPPSACTAESPCNGDFACDGDVDGTDAALFKRDFGRRAGINPCPSRSAGPWCAYP